MTEHRKAPDARPSGGDGPGGRRWAPMRVTHLGDVQELIKSGEGKQFTTFAGDPGEVTKKPQPQGSS